MVWPFKKDRSAPSPREMVKAQTRGEMVVNEDRSITAEMQAAGGVAFDFQAIDDEKILELFDSSKPLFHPLLLPLLPMVSRLNFLSNCSEKDAKIFKFRVDIMMARLKNQSGVCDSDGEDEDNTVDYMLLDALETYLHMRINDSIKGFKIRTLTERKRTLTIQEEQLNKKGRLGGLLS